MFSFETKKRQLWKWNLLPLTSTSTRVVHFISSFKQVASFSKDGYVIVLFSEQTVLGETLKLYFDNSTASSLGTKCVWKVTEY